MIIIVLLQSGAVHHYQPSPLGVVHHYQPSPLGAVHHYQPSPLDVVHHYQTSPLGAVHHYQRVSVHSNRLPPSRRVFKLWYEVALMDTTTQR